MNIKNYVMDVAEATAIVEMINAKVDFEVNSRFGKTIMEFAYCGDNDYICELTGDYYSTNIIFNINKVEIRKVNGRNFLRMAETKVYMGV